MNKVIQLRWSDAWLLLAIYYTRDCQRNCLSALIAAADYIDHAIMNYEELVSGIVRLKSTELIAEMPDKSKFSCSEKAMNIIEPIVRRTKSAYEVRKEIEHNINAVPWCPGEPIPHPENSLEYDGLTREIYQSAVDEYLKNIKVK